MGVCLCVVGGDDEAMGVVDVMIVVVLMMV